MHGSLATDHITTAGLFLSRRISSAITSTWWSKLSFPKLFLEEKTGSIKTKYLAEEQKEDTRFKVSEKSLSENLNDERELLVQGQFKMPLVFKVRKRAVAAVQSRAIVFARGRVAAAFGSDFEPVCL